MWTATLKFNTDGRGFTDLTSALQAEVASSSVTSGLLNAFLLHTSASLIVCENADPAVQLDLERYVSELVFDGDRRFTHVAEGPDDMSAHIRSVLTQTSLSIPIRGGRLALGTWQGIYLWEHRTHPHSRRLEVTILGPGPAKPAHPSLLP